MRRLIGDTPVLIAEVVAMREALRKVGLVKMDNVIVKSDLQLLINSILGTIEVPSYM